MSLQNLAIEVKDGIGYSKLYNAICSSNVELFDELVTNWTSPLDDLEDILSRAYEDLKIKNVPLSDDIQIFVENKLINFRFFSTSKKCNSSKDNGNNIKKRIQFVIENIFLLLNSENEKVDEKFLYVATSIAQNIHILKKQLKSFYDRLPWEEIEFCLICFVWSHKKQQEINLFFRAILTRTKILNHLKHFAKKLEENRNTINETNKKLATVPNLTRDTVIADIINNYPQFEELYNDYQEIRDAYSLEKISDCIKLALLVDPDEREGQLVIIRVLQILGEYLKNSLESPKLSSNTSQLFLLYLSKDTRNIIIDLRNSLSHAYSLSRRLEIEKKTDTNFFSRIQSDIKKIDTVITDILSNKKMNMIKILLKKILESKSSEELREVAEIFINVDVLSTFVKKGLEKSLSSIKVNESNKLDLLIKELSDNITEKTDYEIKLFSKINDLFKSANIRTEITEDHYVRGFVSLSSLLDVLSNNIDHNTIRIIKYMTNQTLKQMNSKIEVQNVKKIGELSVEIANSVNSRLPNHELGSLFCNIWLISEFETGDVKWIRSLKRKIKEVDSFIPPHKQNKISSLRNKFKTHLALKQTELKGVLNKKLQGQIIKKISDYKTDKKLQTIVEMLLLDIMSTLSNYLEENRNSLDDNTPVLTGKCLRNHLAHDNLLCNILISDPILAVISNAMRITEEDLLGNKKKIGKIFSNSNQFREKYVRGLAIITIQKRMFDALEKGNLEILKDCLKKGADINARNVELWTTLHFASKGQSLPVIKFVLAQNININGKDINGQTALHVAAAYGRTSIVQFFVEKTNLNVDNCDNRLRTPLHIAAKNGHKDSVEILLQNNASTLIQDINGQSSLHCALRNNHIEVAKILLHKDINVDINEAKGGFTPLHIVAEFGYLDLVMFLLQNKAHVNGRTDEYTTPLHLAALNGHLEVVNTLILHGAEINANVLNGCTPLHYAVEKGHGDIANILLSHGATVNAYDKTYFNTPLHYAAQDGHEQIVRALLENKANGNVFTSAGISPLHFAVLNGHLAIVDILLKHNVNINAKDKYNQTPLHYAAGNGHNKVAEHLITNGAIINAKSVNYETPLHLSAMKSHEDITDFLLKSRADVNIQDIIGDVPLHKAALNNNTAVIEILVKNGAHINARNNIGVTPLHIAALNGNCDVIVHLLKNGADVNAKSIVDGTPLHLAIFEGHKDVVNLLIKNNASVNSGVGFEISLNRAIEAGHREIVEILIANGADLKVKFNGLTPLLSAVKNNREEIVEVIVAHDTKVDADDYEPLILAVLKGYTDIVKILLEGKDVNKKHDQNATLLHLAVQRGHVEIVNILIKKGAHINSASDTKCTPLFIAVQHNFEEVVDILIEHGADINVKDEDGVTPLQQAAFTGYENIAKLLLSRGAHFNTRDKKNRTPLEQAVAHNHLQVVKILLEYQKSDINIKGNDNFSILHIASQENNLEIVKYLLSAGCDINARNARGSKSIHIAAREGHKDIVEFFLNKGLKINDLGTANQSLLHYASIEGHLDVVAYLIQQGADVNAKDLNGRTPLHIAAKLASKNTVEFLLRNGAFYDIFDNARIKPFHLAITNKESFLILKSTENLFTAVKQDNCKEVKICIESGAVIDAKNCAKETPLHYAAWKGHDKVANILLQNNADPNILGKNQCTPLHYAAKFSHIKIVMALLTNGAIFNASSDSGKTPLDFTSDKSIRNLLKLLSESFRKIKNGNINVVNDLNKIKDIDEIKAIMNAHNEEQKTLIVAAIHSNFSKVDQLKEVLQGDISTEINAALILLDQGNYNGALTILKHTFEKRKEILGPDNPGSLDIQKHIATVYYKQGEYQRALLLLEEIVGKQTQILGLNNKDTLSTRSIIALVLYRQGKDEDAFNIFQEVYENQKKILGSNHIDTCNTQFHLALVLDKLGKYEEALIINRKLFKQRKESLGANHANTIRAQNNIAMVLSKQGKHKEALLIYKEVLEKKKLVLGIHHADTLRTLHNIAGVFILQKQYQKALETQQEVLNMQQKALGPHHPETLNTQYNMGNVFFVQGKWIGALKMFKVLEKMKIVFGPNHTVVLDILKKMKIINEALKFKDTDIPEVLKHIQNEINTAANNGDVQTVQRLLKDGFHVNDKDPEGRTPLHFAVSSGNVSVVNILLNNDADINQVTNKGNTPLHTASSKGYKEIVELLLQNNKLSNFINAKTTITGSTALHIAVKNGFLEVTKTLLEAGAFYNVKNNEGKTPLDFSKDKNIINLLTLIKDLFDDFKKGDIKIFRSLRATNNFLAVVNARDNDGNTLIQIYIAKGHKHIASQLLDLLKSQTRLKVPIKL